MNPGDINLDYKRQDRLGFDEAIFCEGKTIAQINAILTRAKEQEHALLLTRLSEDKYILLEQVARQRIDYDNVSQTGIFNQSVPVNQKTKVAIICAGTSDVGVAREVARTLQYYGEPGLEIYDVGVAGLWRLMERIDEIENMPVAVVVAGMDAALPSVVGGLFKGLIIALPTSVGYGVAEGGHTALNAMLASCAPGIPVMNIDNGYGAACAALRAIKAFT